MIVSGLLPARRNVVKLDTHYWFTMSATDDVRWELVEHIKQVVTGGTYAVPAIQVAARLFRHMLELDRARHRREHSGASSGETGWRKPGMSG
jgi:hypothetical protein